MLWETHIRIANEVLQRLALSISSVEAEQLRKGVLIPDKWGDYPHHYGKSNAIMEHILEARRLFLLSDLPHAYFFLGVALHYIQDSYTSLSSRSIYHQAWEQDIEESYLMEDLQRTVELSFADRRNLKEKYSNLVQSLSSDIQGKQNTLALATLLGHERPSEGGNPTVDLNMAFKASFLVTKSVLSCRNNPELKQDLDRNLAEHEELLKQTETAFTDKLVDLIKKRDELMKRKEPTGIISKIKNLFLSLAIAIRNLQVRSKIQEYDQRRHLQRVVREYKENARRITAPHEGWYIFDVPEINMDVVEKQMLSIDEIAMYFGFHESTLRNLIEEGKISCYKARNRDLIKRSALKKILPDFSVRLSEREDEPW